MQNWKQEKKWWYFGPVVWVTCFVCVCVCVFVLFVLCDLKFVCWYLRDGTPWWIRKSAKGNVDLVIGNNGSVSKTTTATDWTIMTGQQPIRGQKMREPNCFLIGAQPIIAKEFFFVKVQFYQINQIISRNNSHFVHTLFTHNVWTIHEQYILFMFTLVCSDFGSDWKPYVQPTSLLFQSPRRRPPWNSAPKIGWVMQHRTGRAGATQHCFCCSCLIQALFNSRLTWV